MHPRPIRAASLIVAAAFSVSVADLRGPGRTHDICRPRFVACWLARRFGAGYAQIGRYLNRHHATVIYAYRKVERQRAADAEFRAFTDTLLASRPHPTRRPVQAGDGPVQAGDGPDADGAFYDGRRSKNGRLFLEEQDARFRKAMRNYVD